MKNMVRKISYIITNTPERAPAPASPRRLSETLPLFIAQQNGIPRDFAGASLRPTLSGTACECDAVVHPRGGRGRRLPGGRRRLPGFHTENAVVFRDAEDAAVRRIQVSGVNRLSTRIAQCFSCIYVTHHVEAIAAKSWPCGRAEWRR